MLRGALRLAAGTVSLATGGWVLRALHGAPAALGAQPSDIRAVAERSPNFRDGVFVNLEPASKFSIDREEQRLMLWEVVGGLGRHPTRGGDPVGYPRGREPSRPLPARSRSAGSATRRRCWRSTGTAFSPTRCGVNAARPRTSSARGGCIRRRCRWKRCRPWTRSSSATTITTTSTSTRSSRWLEASGPRSSFRSASARTCVIGAFPTSASSNSTGTSTRRSTSSP